LVFTVTLDARALDIRPAPEVPAGRLAGACEPGRAGAEVVACPGLAPLDALPLERMCLTKMAFCSMVTRSPSPACGNPASRKRLSTRSGELFIVPAMSRTVSAVVRLALSITVHSPLNQYSINVRQQVRR